LLDSLLQEISHVRMLKGQDARFGIFLAILS